MLRTIILGDWIAGELIILWVSLSPMFKASLDAYGMAYRLSARKNLWITFFTAMIVSLFWPLAFVAATNKFLKWLQR